MFLLKIVTFAYGQTLLTIRRVAVGGKVELYRDQVAFSGGSCILSLVLQILFSYSLQRRPLLHHLLFPKNRLSQYPLMFPRKASFYFRIEQLFYFYFLCSYVLGESDFVQIQEFQEELLRRLSLLFLLP